MKKACIWVILWRSKGHSFQTIERWTYLEDLAAMEKGLQALFRKLPVFTSSLVVCAIWNIILRFLNVKNKSLRWCRIPNLTEPYWTPGPMLRERDSEFWAHIFDYNKTDWLTGMFADADVRETMVTWSVRNRAEYDKVITIFAIVYHLSTHYQHRNSFFL